MRNTIAILIVFSLLASCERREKQEPANYNPMIVDTQLVRTEWQKGTAEATVIFITSSSIDSYYPKTDVFLQFHNYKLNNNSIIKLVSTEESVISYSIQAPGMSEDNIILSFMTWLAGGGAEYSIAYEDQAIKINRKFISEVSPEQLEEMDSSGNPYIPPEKELVAIFQLNGVDKIYIKNTIELK